MTNDNELILMPRLDTVVVSNEGLKKDLQALSRNINSLGLLKLQLSLDASKINDSSIKNQLTATINNIQNDIKAKPMVVQTNVVANTEEAKQKVKEFIKLQSEFSGFNISKINSKAIFEDGKDTGRRRVDLTLYNEEQKKSINLAYECIKAQSGVIQIEQRQSENFEAQAKERQRLLQAQIKDQQRLHREYQRAQSFNIKSTVQQMVTPLEKKDGGYAQLKSYFAGLEKDFLGDDARRQQVLADYKTINSLITERISLTQQLAKTDRQKNPLKFNELSTQLEDATRKQGEVYNRTFRDNKINQEIVGTDKLNALSERYEGSLRRTNVLLADRADKMNNVIKKETTLEPATIQRVNKQVQILQGRIDGMKKNWSKMLGDSDTVGKLLAVEKQLSKVGGDPAKLRAVSRELQLLSNNTMAAELNQKSFGDRVFETGKRLGAYLTSMLMYRVVFGTFRDAIQSIKDMDSAMTDLRVVTGWTTSQAKENIMLYNQFARELGVTTKAVIEGADAWLRQGKSVEDTNHLIGTSTMFARVAKISTAEATELLTAALNGYKLEAKDALGVTDMFNAVDLVAATSAKELGTAYQYVAASAGEAGVLQEKLTALLAVGSEQTRLGAEIIGNAWRTLISRMQNIKVGRFIDDETGEDLNDVLKVLGKLNVQVVNSNGVWREFGDVFDEIGAKWNTFDQTQQNAISTAIAGTRQANIFRATMSNYADVIKYTEVAQNSAGTTLEKFGVVADSIDYKINNLKESTVALWQNLIDSQVVKWIVGAGSGLIAFASIGEGVIAKLALLITTVAGLSAAFRALSIGTVATNFSNFFKSISGLPSRLTQIGMATKSISASNGARGVKELGVAISTLSRNQQLAILSTQNLTKTQMGQALASAGLTKEKIRQALAVMEVNKAQKVATASTWGWKAAMDGLKVSIMSNPVGAILTAITIGLSIAIPLFSKFKNAQQEVIDKANETANTYKERQKTISESISTIQSLEEKFKKLSKGVDDYGNNISLSTEEYNEYQDVLQQILGISPQLITGYTEEGKAIANKNNLIERSIELLKQERQERLNEMTSPEKTKEVGAGAVARVKTAEKDSNLTSSKKQLENFLLDVELSRGLDVSYDIAEILGIKSGLTENIANSMGPLHDLIADNIDSIAVLLGANQGKLAKLLTPDQLRKFNELIAKYIKDLNKYNSDLDKAQKSFNDHLMLYAQSSDGYDGLIDAQRDFVSQYVNGFKISGKETEAQLQQMADDVRAFVDEIGNNDQLKQAINKLFSFDLGKMSTEEYRRALSNDIGEISILLSELGEQSKHALLALNEEGKIDFSLFSLLDDSQTFEQQLKDMRAEMVKTFGKRGNIDLLARPIIENKDGTYSSIDAATYEIEGKLVLLPTVDETGHLTDEQVVEKFKTDGRHLGIFDVNQTEEADEYARKLNEIQDKYYGLIRAKQSLMSMGWDAEGIDNAFQSLLKQFKKIEGFAAINIKKIDLLVDGQVDKNGNLLQKGLADKLSKITPKQLKTLPFPDLEIAYKIVPKSSEMTFEQLVSAIERTKRITSSVNESFDGVRKSVTDYAESIKELTSAYSSLSNGETLSLDSIMALLETSPELIAALEVQNGLLTLNKENVKEVLQAKAEAFRQEMVIKEKAIEMALAEAEISIDAIQKVIEAKIADAHSSIEVQGIVVEAQQAVINSMEGMAIATVSAADIASQGMIAFGQTTVTVSDLVGQSLDNLRLQLSALDLSKTHLNDKLSAIRKLQQVNVAKQIATSGSSSSSGSGSSDKAAKQHKDYAEKVQKINEDLEKKEKEFQKKMDELAKKERLELLKQELEQRKTIIDQYNRIGEVLTLKMELTDTSDFIGQMGVLSERLDNAKSKGAAMREEFERLIGLAPQSADEAQAIESSIISLGNEIRSNIKDVTKFTQELKMLEITSISTSLENRSQMLQDEIKALDSMMDLVIKRSEIGMLGSLDIFASMSLLPIIPESALEQKRRENDALINEQERYQAEIEKIIQTSLRMQAEENARAREEERQALIEGIEEAREAAAKSLEEAAESLSEGLKGGISAMFDDIVQIVDDGTNRIKAVFSEKYQEIANDLLTDFIDPAKETYDKWIDENLELISTGLEQEQDNFSGHFTLLHKIYKDFGSEWSSEQKAQWSRDLAALVKDFLDPAVDKHSYTFNQRLIEIYKAYSEAMDAETAAEYTKRIIELGVFSDNFLMEWLDFLDKIKPIEIKIDTEAASKAIADFYDKFPTFVGPPSTTTLIPFLPDGYNTGSGGQTVQGNGSGKQNFSKYTVTSPFGEQRSNGTHGGVDFGVPHGTPIQTPVGGTLRNLNEKNGFGKYVTVTDSNGYTHYFAHLSKHNGSDRMVSAGDVVGISGNTGRSTGPHLHYEVRTSSGKKINPASFYADGTNAHPGGLAVVGDEFKGAYEIVITPDGRIDILGRNNPQLIDLPKGSTVIPHNETEQILKTSTALNTLKENHIHAYAEGTGNAAELKESLFQLSNIKQLYSPEFMMAQIRFNAEHQVKVDTINRAKADAELLDKSSQEYTDIIKDLRRQTDELAQADLIHLNKLKQETLKSAGDFFANAQSQILQGMTDYANGVSSGAISYDSEIWDAYINQFSENQSRLVDIQVQALEAQKQALEYPLRAITQDLDRKKFELSQLQSENEDIKSRISGIANIAGGDSNRAFAIFNEGNYKEQIQLVQEIIDKSQEAVRAKKQAAYELGMTDMDLLGDSDYRTLVENAKDAENELESIYRQQIEDRLAMSEEYISQRNYHNDWANDSEKDAYQRVLDYIEEAYTQRKITDKEYWEWKEQYTHAKIDSERRSLEEAEGALRTKIDMVVDLIRSETEIAVKGIQDEIEAYQKKKEVIDEEQKQLEKNIKLERERSKEKIDALKEEVDTYTDLITRKKQALDLDKDSYDYTKNLEEKKKDIAKLESRLLELAGNDSLAARAERLKLEEELANKRADLDDFVYENDIKNQKNALDMELDGYKKEKEASQKAIEDDLEQKEKAYEKETDIMDAKKEEYDLIIKERQKQIDELEKSIENSGEVALAAMRRIDIEGDALLASLVANNKIYGSGIDEDVKQKWNEANRALNAHNSELESALSTYENIERIMQRIDALNYSLYKPFDTADIPADDVPTSSSPALDTLQAIGDGIRNFGETVRSAFAEKIRSFLPSYDIGTSYIKEDQIAKVHEGEGIFTKHDNRYIREMLPKLAFSNDRILRMQETMAIGFAEKASSLASIASVGNRPIEVKIDNSINVDGSVDERVLVKMESMMKQNTENIGRTIKNVLRSNGIASPVSTL